LFLRINSVAPPNETIRSSFYIVTDLGTAGIPPSLPNDTLNYLY